MTLETLNLNRSAWILGAVLVLIHPVAFADPQLLKAVTIRIVYMGGDDCPPCVAWRKNEFPKLEKTDAFKAIKFSCNYSVQQTCISDGCGAKLK